MLRRRSWRLISLGVGAVGSRICSAARFYPPRLPWRAHRNEAAKASPREQASSQPAGARRGPSSAGLRLRSAMAPCRLAPRPVERWARFAGLAYAALEPWWRRAPSMPMVSQRSGHTTWRVPDPGGGRPDRRGGTRPRNASGRGPACMPPTIAKWFWKPLSQARNDSGLVELGRGLERSCARGTRWAREWRGSSRGLPRANLAKAAAAAGAIGSRMPRGVGETCSSPAMSSA